MYWAVNDNGRIFSSSGGKIWTSNIQGIKMVSLALPMVIIDMSQ